MPWFWNAFYSLATLVLWPRWAWRALRAGEYTNGLGRKLSGQPPPLPDQTPVIWMHGVCVGEVLLLRPLIDRLQSQRPDDQIVLSTFSRSGWIAAQKAFPGIPLFYVPLDLTWAVRRVYRALRPRLLLLSELELWPNLLLEAGRRGIPVIVASSRINDTDLRFYRCINRWHRPALRCISWWGAQTPRDAERIRELLGPDHSTQIEVTGSLKYDAAVDRTGRTDALRTRLGYSTMDRVLVAGSTHEPEEQLLLDLLKRQRGKHPELKLLIAPRDAERFSTVARAATRGSFSVIRLSRIPAGLTAAAQVTVADTVGELPALWGIADFAFVGGTWTTGIGGHSPIEPAAVGKPVCFGPHVWNFEQATQGLLAAGGAVRFDSPEQLEAIVARWLDQPQTVQEMGHAAAEFVSSNRGAVDATFKALCARLEATATDGG